MLSMSKFDEGSSKTKIGASITAVDAQAIFCFSPPDKLNRFLSNSS